MTDTQLPVIIVGGGLSGLSTAALLARAGHAVTVFEKSHTLGGRARTKQYGTFSFNQGAHAFYLGGPGEQLLNELGVRGTGLIPDKNQFLALDDGKLHTFPTGAISLFRTTLLNLSAKGAFVHLFSTLKHADLTRLQQVSVQDWLEQHVRHPQIRQLMLALARLTTYTNAPEMIPAGLVIPLLNAQVRYLDGGWQTLVDGLRQIAVASGAKVVTHARVAAIEVSEERHTVRLADGTAHQALAVVLALDPQSASSLIANGTHKELNRWAAQSVPARRVARYLLGLMRKAPEDSRFHVALINGQPEIILYNKGMPSVIMTLDMLDGQIWEIDVIVNPDKLQGVPTLN